jgi:hypothetical protein
MIDSIPGSRTFALSTKKASSGPDISRASIAVLQGKKAVSWHPRSPLLTRLFTFSLFENLEKLKS